MNPQRRLPPYSKEFALRAEDTPFIFVGWQAWDWARRDTRRKLVLPPDSSPSEFKWLVVNMEIIVIDTGATDEALLHLSYELLRAGALKVAVIPHKVPRIGGLAIITREVRHAA